MCCPEVHSDLPCNGSLVHMLFKQQASLHVNLERRFLTHIAHLCYRYGRNFIRVQGRREDVDKTVAYLQGMLKMPAEEQLPSPSPSPSPTNVTTPVERLRPVVVVDPRKLRPIVIDGSNVAMRWVCVCVCVSVCVFVCIRVTSYY